MSLSCRAACGAKAGAKRAGSTVEESQARLLARVRIPDTSSPRDGLCAPTARIILSGQALRTPHALTASRHVV